MFIFELIKNQTMRILYFLFFILNCFLFIGNLLAQQNPELSNLPFVKDNKISQPINNTLGGCGSDVMMQLKRRNAAFVQAENNMNAVLLQAKNIALDTTIVLPVVVHIVHNAPNTITDAFIQSKIVDLNNAFAKQGAYSASAGVDTKITFCLAQTDPDGGTSSGITRNTSYLGYTMNATIEDARLKNLIQWPPSSYINIWYIQSMELFIFEEFSCGAWSPSKAGGYATFPPGGGLTDGIVVTAFGPLLAHEIGHYLGLYHTFEGGCLNNDCSLNGDRVCDTPPDNSRVSISCGSTMNTCVTDTLSGFTTDQLDLTKNFMDYGNQTCMNMFTQGQSDRMRNAINTLRPGLLVNKCNNPCAENSTSFFNVDILYPVAGNTVNFTNATTNATNYQWYVDGVLQASTANFSYTFNTEGKYKIALRAFNADANCYANYIRYVIVNCGVVARFYPNKTKLSSALPLYPGTVLFTNKSEGAATYEWWMNSSTGMPWQVVSTSLNLNYTFPIAGFYGVKLIARNGSCVDSTLVQTIEVINATPDGYAFVNSLQCFQDSGLRMQLNVCNNGYATIPAGIPISFYEYNPTTNVTSKLPSTYYTPTQVLGKCCQLMGFNNVFYKHTGFKRLFISFNDSGSIVTPITLPNNDFVELNYGNNIFQYTNEYIASVNPNNVTALLPAATVTLNATANHSTSSFTWSTTNGLSCTVCPSTLLTIDSSRVIRVVAMSTLGCYDTAFVNVTVPPSDDFTATILKATCTNQDSLLINFQIKNGFAPGKIHANLKVSFYYGDPRIAGAQLLPPVYSLPITINATTTTISNYKIKNMPAGNLFAVVNDVATAIPISLPSTSFVESNYVNNISSKIYDPSTYAIFNQTICQGQNYWGYTTTGIYKDTFVNATGCDSVRTLNLTVNPKTFSTLNATICQGQNYLGYTNTGTFVATFINQYGCDSIRTVNLIVNQKSSRLIKDTICEGQSSYGYTTSGTYIDTFLNAVNCDSVRTLQLVVKPKKYSTVTATICEGRSFEGYTVSGIYTPIFLAANGCDSTRTINLTVLPTKRTSVNKQICDKDSIYLQNAWQKFSGIYYDSLTSSYNCDSIVTTSLIVNPLPLPNLGNDISICALTNLVLNPGNFTSYIWQNGSTASTFTANTIGTYFVKVTDINGCKKSDTMEILQINPLPINFLKPADNYCRGNGYVITVPGYTKYSWTDNNNIVLSTTNTLDVNKFGIFTLKVTDVNGCEATEEITLTDKGCTLYLMPNAFTPNKDANNETIKPQITQRVANYNFKIFNRWGKMVFSTTDKNIGWDGTYSGKDQSVAAYIYYLSFTDFDNSPHFYKGTIMLIR
jgi:gliding motility-associated-like protein